MAISSLLPLLAGMLSGGTNYQASRGRGRYRGDQINMAQARLALQQQQLQERQREFNENMGFRQKQLDAGVGTGGGRQGVFQQRIAAKRAILARNPDAIRPDGTVDLNAMSPLDRQDYSQLDLLNQKRSGSAYALKRYQQGANLMTTIDKLDITPLQHYAGAGGKTKLLKDRAKTLKGIDVPIYDAYVSLLNTKLPAAADQLGAYWSGSVQEAAQKARLQMFNPDSIFSNPQIILKSFNDLKDIARSEVENSQKALISPQFIYDRKGKPPAGPYDKEEIDGTVKEAKESPDMAQAAELQKKYKNLSLDQIYTIMQEAKNGIS